MWRVRLRSPLRWLSAVMGSLLLFGLAGILGQTWLIAGVPLLVAVFVLAPPIWVYRHHEAPVERAHLALDAVPNGVQPGVFEIAVTNDSAVPARDFRIRLLVPHEIVPPTQAQRLLGRVALGERGRNWFIDSAGTSTAVTFRAAVKGEEGGIACPANGRLALAELCLPPQGAPYDIILEYQISGGTVAPALGEVSFRS